MNSFYKHEIGGVYCKLVYTFKDNKLRTAGYVTETPVQNADNLIKEAVNKTRDADRRSREHGLEKFRHCYLCQRLYFGQEAEPDQI